MKNIFKILKNDLKSIAKNIIVFIVVIGISVLPALYAWFNIAANWDPYSSTGGIPFAVCSKDEGYSYKVITVNAGDKIVQNLKMNDKMGWTFVSEEEAINGVKNGTYYAAVVIPENFTRNLFSVTTGKFEQATLQYYVNEKQNAISPKITDKGIQTIEESVNSTYVSTLTQLLATTLNLTADQIGGSKVDAANNMISALQESRNQIEGFDSTVDVFISTLDTLDGLVKTNKDMLPTIESALKKGSLRAEGFKENLTAAKSASQSITDSIDNILDATKDYTTVISNEMEDAFTRIKDDSDNASEKLVALTARNEKIMAVNTEVITVLDNIHDFLGIDVSSLTGKLSTANEKQQSIIDALTKASETVKKTGILPEDTMNELRSLVAASQTDVDSIITSYSAIKLQIDSAIDKAYTGLDSVQGLLDGMSGDIPNVSASFDNASDTIASMRKTFTGLKDFMSSAESSIDKMIDKIAEFRDDKNIENIIDPIINDPEALGRFISSPVTTETNRIWPVENYGSGMTPFYTSLGFWVGGVILVAVTRTDLKKHELRSLDRPTSTHLFFGRYLIFFLLGQVQALIISLGDLFFLRIQCSNPLLFIAGSLVSSFVYILIIYSLTITFSVIGKALSVIILVIQIAGSGGTFPIEVLPAPFQAVSPFLPFKYGINALREAVAGADLTAYTHDILMLLAFVPFALVLGILLRKPCIGIISFFNKRIEQSDIII